MAAVFDVELWPDRACHEARGWFVVDPILLAGGAIRIYIRCMDVSRYKLSCGGFWTAYPVHHVPSSSLVGVMCCVWVVGCPDIRSHPGPVRTVHRKSSGTESPEGIECAKAWLLVLLIPAERTTHDNKKKKGVLAAAAARAAAGSREGSYKRLGTYTTSPGMCVCRYSYS